MLTLKNLPDLQAAIADANVDGWLIFDFHGTNPIAGGMLRLTGLVSRRVFAFIPHHGTPVALTHAIEQGPWARWPKEWKREVYSSWRSLDEHLAALVNGKRVTIPSYRVRQGDVVALKPASRELFHVRRNLDTLDRQLPPWLETVGDRFEVRVFSLPLREHIDEPVQEQLIVELYSK